MTTPFHFDIFLSLKIVKERRDSLIREIGCFLLVFLFFLQVSEATPNLHNTRGLFRVLSGGIHEEGELILSLGGENLKYSGFPDTSFAYAPLYVPWRIGRVDLTYTPLDRLELYGIGIAIQQRFQYTGEPKRSGFGDLEMGFKIGAMEKSWVEVGGMGYGIFPTGAEGFSNELFQWGGRGLLALKGSPLEFHGNVGYNRNERGREDLLLLGFGIHLPTSLFSPTIEFTSEQDLKSPFLENPLRFTSGLRFHSPFGPVIDFGYDVNLTNENGFPLLEPQDYSLLLGVQLITSLSLFTSKTGTIMGRVLDSETGEPLEANLLILREKRGVVLCDSRTGTFTIHKVLPGLKTLEVTCKGYKKKILPVLVKQSERSEREISLEKIEED